VLLVLLLFLWVQPACLIFSYAADDVKQAPKQELPSDYGFTLDPVLTTIAEDCNVVFKGPPNTEITFRVPVTAYYFISWGAAEKYGTGYFAFTHKKSAYNMTWQNYERAFIVNKIAPIFLTAGQSGVQNQGPAYDWAAKELWKYGFICTIQLVGIGWENIVSQQGVYPWRYNSQYWRGLPFICEKSIDAQIDLVSSLDDASDERFAFSSGTGQEDGVCGSQPHLAGDDRYPVGDFALESLPAWYYLPYNSPSVVAIFKKKTDGNGKVRFTVWGGRIILHASWSGGSVQAFRNWSLVPGGLKSEGGTGQFGMPVQTSGKITLKLRLDNGRNMPLNPSPGIFLYSGLGSPALAPPVYFGIDTSGGVFTDEYGEFSTTWWLNYPTWSPYGADKTEFWYPYGVSTWFSLKLIDGFYPMKFWARPEKVVTGEDPMWFAWTYGQFGLRLLKSVSTNMPKNTPSDPYELKWKKVIAYSRYAGSKQATGVVSVPASPIVLGSPNGGCFLALGHDPYQESLNSLQRKIDAFKRYVDSGEYPSEYWPPMYTSSTPLGEVMTPYFAAPSREDMKTLVSQYEAELAKLKALPHDDSFPLSRFGYPPSSCTTANMLEAKFNSGDWEFSATWSTNPVWTTVEKIYGIESWGLQHLSTEEREKLYRPVFFTSHVEETVINLIPLLSSLPTGASNYLTEVRNHKLLKSSSIFRMSVLQSPSDSDNSFNTKASWLRAEYVKRFGTLGILEFYERVGFSWRDLQRLDLSLDAKYLGLSEQSLRLSLLQCAGPVNRVPSTVKPLSLETCLDVSVGSTHLFLPYVTVIAVVAAIITFVVFALLVVKPYAAKKHVRLKWSLFLVLFLFFGLAVAYIVGFPIGPLSRLCPSPEYSYPIPASGGSVSIVIPTGTVATATQTTATRTAMTTTGAPPASMIPFSDMRIFASVLIIAALIFLGMIFLLAKSRKPRRR